MPLKLAIALLKDSKGVIDLDIPVQGSLDDPEFSIMPIVWKVLLNVLVKAVTSPFKLLGALFGGDDEDLEFVNFPAGVDTLVVSEQAKLDSLAKALNERPGLKLDVRGVAAPSIDRAALAYQAVAAQVLIDADSIDFSRLTGAEREQIFKLFSNTFSELPNLLVLEKDESGKKIPRDEWEAAVAEAAFQRLVADYQLSEDELRELAQRRAAVIKDRLVLRNGIEEVRVYFLDVNTDASAGEEGVQVQLALDVR